MSNKHAYYEIGDYQLAGSIWSGGTTDLYGHFPDDETAIRELRREAHLKYIGDHLRLYGRYKVIVCTIFTVTNGQYREVDTFVAKGDPNLLTAPPFQIQFIIPRPSQHS